MSLFVSGVTAKEMIEPSASQPFDGSPGNSKLDMLREKLATLLETKPEFVDIFTVRDVPNTGPPHTHAHKVDMRYVAHGSPYYTTARLDGLVYANKASVSNKFSVFIMLMFFLYK